MLKNYIIIAWRNFWKNRTFSLINTTGLALGMICSLPIMLWVLDERSVDAFLKNKERIFSIYERQYYDKTINAFHGTRGILADQIKKDIPEIEFATGMSWDDTYTFSAGEKKLKLLGGYGGTDFFKIFSFPLLEGNKATALATPVSLAISKKMAEIFFGGSIDLRVFLLAALIAMLIALTTISIHAVKAALANPVKSLRTE